MNETPAIPASTIGHVASDPAVRPTAAGILSGFPETGQTSTGAWSCDSGSSKPPECWEHINNYLDCLVNGRPPEQVVQSCKGPNGRYETASPLRGAWSYPATPPMFIANAGLGAGNADLSPLQLALDFHSTLQNAPGYTDGTNLKLCQVASGGHATGYLDKEIRSCQGDTGVEVIESIVAFFVANFVP